MGPDKCGAFPVVAELTVNKRFVHCHSKGIENLFDRGYVITERVDGNVKLVVFIIDEPELRV
jgi:hypothetical protein